MPRTVLTPVTVKGPYPVLPVTALSLDITYVAGDNVNGNEFTGTGREVLLVRNTAGGAGTFTLISAANEFRRLGNVTTYSVGAGLVSAFYFGNLSGWDQGAGKIHIDVSASTMTLVVIRLP